MTDCPSVRYELILLLLVMFERIELIFHKDAIHCVVSHVLLKTLTLTDFLQHVNRRELSSAVARLLHRAPTSVYNTLGGCEAERRAVRLRQGRLVIVATIRLDVIGRHSERLI